MRTRLDRTDPLSKHLPPPENHAASPPQIRRRILPRWHALERVCRDANRIRRTLGVDGKRFPVDLVHVVTRLVC